MKVAFIVDNFPVLSQTFILNQITGLYDHGYEVDIYANPTQELTTHVDVKQYGLLKQTHYFSQTSTNHVMTLLQSLRLGLRIASKHPKIILDWLINGFRHAQKTSLPIWIFPYIATPFISKKNYDIIHCHFGPNGLKGALIQEMGLTKGKLITSFHGYDITKYLQEYGAHGYQHLFEVGDLFLPISKNWQHKLIELGCDESKIIVHRMGVDCEKFAFIPRQVREGEKIRIISIARLVEKKGIEYGIRAIGQLVKTHVDVSKLEYIIIGDGCLKDSLQQLIRELNIESIVSLWGWKKQDEIQKILNHSHILIAPSITSINGDQEGIPVVLMEAMAMGIPVISTLHSGIPELVEDSVSGFLVAEKDIKALADRLKFLIDHPEIWPEMGKAGRRYIEANHNIHHLNQQLVDIYKKIIS